MSYLVVRYDFMPISALCLVLGWKYRFEQSLFWGIGIGIDLDLISIYLQSLQSKYVSSVSSVTKFSKPRNVERLAISRRSRPVSDPMTV
jgi:hypothetical protein